MFGGSHAASRLHELTLRHTHGNTPATTDTWLVASSTGAGRTRDLALERKFLSLMLSPVGAVAVHLTRDGVPCLRPLTPEVRALRAKPEGAWLESLHLESRPKAQARLGLEVSVRWRSPSSCGLWNGDALLLSLHRRCWKPGLELLDDARLMPHTAPSRRGVCCSRRLRSSPPPRRLPRPMRTLQRTRRSQRQTESGTARLPL